MIECTGFEKDSDGNIIKIFCDYLPDTKSGTPGAEMQSKSKEIFIGYLANMR